ncbi:hypothetical protein CGRA01v4_08481 [Colletotrichum graminicola]|uniref:UBZ4-type domain-containing protein n=1 Tax=Colletotrichum graminicola (strain M1.001 / M2 / FGSC 10212) TaxID=645133 RepID=E3QJN1_COLGM|nr:uncharacterized protein GLRG_06213 [Colletotrichum graminicola M1.001]EFQ31069.1 hypothetical protein GLRG_06213 [Colletotrichum graminicola M1.001]WDK17198.1 hypothetical protein CGRA01v4_08481 [Colletotrichum graminicola]
MSRVPTVATVVRGASVNIILKADQPTGRTVTGTVQDVLTRGNHPRGIKVRLIDGRVGRVQSHAGAQPISSASDQEPAGAGAGSAASINGRPPRRGQGRRQEADADLPPSQVGLEAYIRPVKQKSGARGRSGAAPGNETADAVSRPAASEVVTCPVCGDFEGDTSAVEHHVASHFD